MWSQIHFGFHYPPSKHSNNVWHNVRIYNRNRLLFPSVLCPKVRKYWNCGSASKHLLRGYELCAYELLVKADIYIETEQSNKERTTRTNKPQEVCIQTEQSSEEIPEKVNPKSKTIGSMSLVGQKKSGRQSPQLLELNNNFHNLHLEKNTQTLGEGSPSST